MATILLVANPGDQRELIDALTGGDDALGDVAIVREVGDDSTLARFVEVGPDVVVVAANLEDGDAGSLIGAMREAILPRAVFVVLVGEVDGPIRTALDALGLGVERFVGRPLAAKALRFAVASGLKAAASTVSLTAAETQPMPATPAPPAPLDLRARWAALADSLGDEDDDERDDEGEGVDEDGGAAVAEAPLVDAGEPAVVESVAPVADPVAVGPAAQPVAAIVAPIAMTTPAPEPSFDDDPLASPAELFDDELPALGPPERPAADAWRPGSTEIPDAGLREPTLILSEPEATAPRFAPAAPIDPIAPIAPIEPPLPPPTAWVSAPGSESVPTWDARPPTAIGDELDDDSLDDGGAAFDDDLSVDLPRAASESSPPPAGGDFARELRKKMSLMAERLFRSGAPAPVASGPAHDHHTEIDLGELVDDDVDLAAATFVGVDDRATDPLAHRVAAPAPTDDGGVLARGGDDAPALIARMFGAAFTGRVVFRAGAAEKTIHFEGGRPVFASSNLVRDRMGELLVREGKISREQHDRCQDLVRDTGRRMGEILVDRGFLKRRELLPAVRRHVEDIIYSLFAWDAGDYRVVVGDGATAERIRLSRHPAAMVLEGVRRKLDHATLERLVGPPSSIYEIVDRDKLTTVLAAAEVGAEERAALAALDGSVDLAAAARGAGLSLGGLYPLVWTMAVLGLASPRRRAGDDDGEAPALVGESDLAIDRGRVEARAALVADADYFALLGVRRDATGFEIRRAYEAARRDFAAESFPPELRRELAAELDDIAAALDEAYRVLRDDSLRATYRDHLREPGEAA